MSDAECLCESCGRPLPGADAVCPSCEGQLVKGVEPISLGKHLCPVCEQSFDRPGHELWPRDAGWYRPRSFKPVCPRCHAFLRDRKNPQPPPGLVLLLAAATMVSYFALPLSYAKGVLLVLVGIYLVALVRRRERHVEERLRFARDEG